MRSLTIDLVALYTVLHSSSRTPDFWKEVLRPEAEVDQPVLFFAAHGLGRCGLL